MNSVSHLIDKSDKKRMMIEYKNKYKDKVE